MCSIFKEPWQGQFYLDHDHIMDTSKCKLILAWYYRVFEQNEYILKHENGSFYKLLDGNISEIPEYMARAICQGRMEPKDYIKAFTNIKIVTEAPKEG